MTLLNFESVGGTKDSWLPVAVSWVQWLNNPIMLAEGCVHPFRFKNFEQLLLGSGENRKLRPGCKRHLGRIFHPPPQVSVLSHLIQGWNISSSIQKYVNEKIITQTALRTTLSVSPNCRCIRHRQNLVHPFTNETMRHLATYLKRWVIFVLL